MRAISASLAWANAGAGRSGGDTSSREGGPGRAAGGAIDPALAEAVHVGPGPDRDAAVRRRPRRPELDPVAGLAVTGRGPRRGGPGPRRGGRGRRRRGGQGRERGG